MSAHAPIAPSALQQLVQCPGSLKLKQSAPAEQLLPDEQDAAEEGIAAHWALAEMFAGRSPLAGEAAPNGVRLTDEMLDAVEVGHAGALRFLGAVAPTVEQPVRIPRIHPECWGTPDVRAWLSPTHLFVGDYKHGFGVVEAFENWQLLAYAVGAISEAGAHDLDVTVTAAILQPRAQHRDGPVRVWRFRAAEVRAQVNVAAAAAAQALGPAPEVRVGASCRHCRARPVCPALMRAAGNAADLADQALPVVLTPAALGVELRHAQRALKLLQARADALEQQALATMRGGRDVPHFRVEHAAGRERWKKPDAEVVALGKMLGLDFAKPQEAVTPAQAAKRGLPDALRAAFAERQTGAATLVPDDGTQARKVFAAPVNFS